MEVFPGRVCVWGSTRRVGSPTTVATRRAMHTHVDTMTVIGNLEQLEAAVLDRDANSGGPGVECVLNQLLDGVCWAVDNL